MKTIEIIVSPKGESTIQTKGFTGASCRDANKFIEQALGQRTGEQLTAEFHQPLKYRRVRNNERKSTDHFVGSLGSAVYELVMVVDKVVADSMPVQLQRVDANPYCAVVKQDVMIWTNNHDIVFDIWPDVRNAERLEVMSFAVEPWRQC